MYCRNCGAPLHDSDAFCPKCGTKVIPPSDGAAKKETDSLLDKYKKNIEDSKHFTPSGPQYEYQQPNSESRQADASEHFTPDNGSAISADTIQPPPETPEEKEKKKQKMLKIILIVLAVILIIVIAVVSIMMGKKRADNEMAVPDKTASAATQIADANSDGDKGGQQRIVVQRKRPRPKKSDYKDPEHPTLAEYFKMCPPNEKKEVKRILKKYKGEYYLSPNKIQYEDGNLVLYMTFYNGTRDTGYLTINNLDLYQMDKKGEKHLIAWDGNIPYPDHEIYPGEFHHYVVTIMGPVPKEYLDTQDLLDYRSSTIQGFIENLDTKKINHQNKSLYLSWNLELN